MLSPQRQPLLEQKRDHACSHSRTPRSEVFRRWPLGDASDVDAALVTSFVIGMLIVGAILLFDFGRRR